MWRWRRDASLPSPRLGLQSIAAQIRPVVFERHRQGAAFYQHHFGTLRRRRFDPATQPPLCTFRAPSPSYLKRTYMRLRDECAQRKTQVVIDAILPTDGLAVRTRCTRRDGCRLYFRSRPPQKLKNCFLHSSPNVLSSSQFVDVDWIVEGRVAGSLAVNESDETYYIRIVIHLFARSARIWIFLSLRPNFRAFVRSFARACVRLLYVTALDEHSTWRTRCRRYTSVRWLSSSTKTCALQQTGTLLLQNKSNDGTDSALFDVFQDTT